MKTAQEIKDEAIEFASDSLYYTDPIIVHDVEEGDCWESWYRAIGILILFSDYPEVNPEGLCPDKMASHLSRIWS